MKKILIAKPNNNIFLNNREDKTKTDLQSSEIIAFAKALQEASFKGYYQDYEIYFANDINTCFENNIGQSNDRRQSGHFGINSNVFPMFKNEFVYGVDAVPTALEKYDEKDVLFVFCGIWDESLKCEYLIQLIKGFKGKIYYILNDLRLDIKDRGILDLFVKKGVTILTQARAYKHKELETKRLAIECLPFYYVNYDKDVKKIHDVIYPYLNFSDIGDYRRGRLSEFGQIQGVKKLWVGAKDIHKFLFPMDSNYYGVQKHNMLHETTKTAKASFIVNEKLYNDFQLLPNRFYEALILGVMPLIDYETAQAVKPQLLHIGKDFNIDTYTLKPDLSDLKEKVNDYELLYKTNQLGQELRMHSNAKINMLNEFRSDICKILEVNNPYDRIGKV